MRALHVIAALVALAGCDGPQHPVDHAPFLVTSDPQDGALVTIGADDQRREVMVVLADENLGDHLFVRFFIDYPGPSEVSHLILQLEVPPSGQAVRAPIRVRPLCAALGLTGAGQHRLMLSASDRPFLDAAQGQDVDPEAPLDSVPTDGHRIRAVWLLNCP